jgi:NAD+ synthase
MNAESQISRDLGSRIAAWLKDYATQAGADGYVVGLSGGIDSACTAVLCQQAVGDHVLSVWMPCYSPAEDGEMARLVADSFGLRAVTVDLGPAYDAMLAALPPEISRMAQANIKPRLRMTALYALAQSHNYLVAGTGNKSELAIGYFTKYGDGGVDIEPLGGLYKWQVRQLASELAVPQPVIDRPPSAGLWAGQTDEGEMGISYEELDRILAALPSLEGAAAGQTADLDPDQLSRVRRMAAASAHKRAMPPIPAFSD